MQYSFFLLCHHANANLTLPSTCIIFSSRGTILTSFDFFLNVQSHCGTEENDERIVICDGCNRGYHTYCLRPVMVNVPTTDWYCDRCRNIHDAARQPYTSFLAELEKDPSAAMTFLDHNFSAAEFYKKHADGLALFGPETAAHIRRKTLGSSKSKATAQMGVRKNFLDFLATKPTSFHAANKCAAASILDCFHYSIGSLLLVVSRSVTANGENPDNTNKLLWSTLFGEKKNKRPNLFVGPLLLAP